MDILVALLTVNRKASERAQQNLLAVMPFIKSVSSKGLLLLKCNKGAVKQMISKTGC